MRSIGIAQRSLDMMLERVTDQRKKPFGKILAEHGTVVANIAKSRAEIEGARLLVLSAAHQVCLSPLTIVVYGCLCVLGRLISSRRRVP